jgi:RNA polymerase subunit RPABC4/transcription elongation factor Spt4
MFDDTLQVCTKHRILQTLLEPCQKCLQEILENRRRLPVVIPAQKEIAKKAEV